MFTNFYREPTRTGAPPNVKIDRPQRRQFTGIFEASPAPGRQGWSSGTGTWGAFSSCHVCEISWVHLFFFWGGGPQNQRCGYPAKTGELKCHWHGNLYSLKICRHSRFIKQTHIKKNAICNPRTWGIYHRLIVSTWAAIYYDWAQGQRAQDEHYRGANPGA